MSLGLLAWPGAIAIGLSLGLFGSGGSILTVPVLIYLFGQDEKIAIAGSLAIVGSIALIGALPYLYKRQIDWRSVLFFGVPGMIGTYGGAWIAQYVSGILQLSIFAGVMLMAAVFMLKPPKLKTANLASEEAFQRSLAKIIIDGLLVGILTGFVGVGGGFLIVPALVLLGGLTMKQAVGTSLLIIAMKSYSGFYKYLDVLDQQNLVLDWKIIISVSVIGIIGSFLGSYFGGKISQDKLKKGFGYFLILMGIWILYKNLPKLIG
jgi:uncharacterized protein